MAARQGPTISRLLDQPLGLTLEQYEDPYVAIIATHPLDSLDLEATRGITRHGLSNSVPAVVARFGVVVLQNPAASRVSLETDVATVWALVGVNCGLAMLDLSFMPLIANQAILSGGIQSRNSEFGAGATNQPGQAIIIRGDIAGTGVFMDQQLGAPGLAWNEFPTARKIRVAPGSLLAMMAVTANLQFFFMFGWREVPVAQNAR